MEHTIAAVATPAAAGGISVIRISGAQAIKIAERVFKPSFKGSLRDMSGYTAAYGRVLSDGREIDEAVATVFLAPKSYTGEDVVEISCHGGIYITRQVLRAVISAGARPAAAGEFTKRAVLNGRMSLTQAEAVADIINANSASGAKAAKNALDGALYKKISGVIGELTDISGNLAAWADFPEEGLDELELSGLSEQLRGCGGKLSDLLSSYDAGQIIKNGVTAAIVGKPNVGKSTLMNLLAGCEKSIVTDIAGTTRDVVEESVVLGDIVLRISDTAGIRETDDKVESVGVSLARKKMGASDLILAVFDGSDELSDEDRQLIGYLKDKPCIAVINKSDLPRRADVEFIAQNIKRSVIISAKNTDSSEDLRKLAEQVEDIVKTDALTGMEAMLANERQRLCAEQAYKSILSAESELESGMTLDAVTVSISDALSSLLELTGESVSEKIIDNVFARFCVGK